MKKKIRMLLKIKYLLMLLTIVLLGSIIINYSMGGNMSSYKNGILSLVSPIRDTYTNIKNHFKEEDEERKSKEELLSQIEELKKENAELSAKLEKYQTDIYELQQLRELLDLKEDYTSYDTVCASVIAKNSGNWFYEFTIDKGSDDGITVNMNVLADGGLAGIVTEVGKNYSIVKSILADDMNVSAISSTTRDTCIVSGDLTLLEKGIIRVMYVHKDAEIMDYDRIVTSSTSSKYLPYILVGYVYDLQKDSNELTKSGYLVPAVDFQHLENVIVVLGTK